MLREEFKKVLIKQRVLLLFTVLLVIQAGYTGFRELYSFTVTKTAEKYDTVYESLTDPLDGKWNPEKNRQLNQWLEESERCLAQYNTLVDQLLAGEITDETLYTYYQSAPFGQTPYTEVLRELDEQRDYIQKNPGRRYMMQTNGWTYFFEDRFVYALYFLFLLVLYIPLFFGERETQMDLLQKLSAKGGTRIFTCQSAVAALIAWGGLCVLELEKFLLYAGRCGLKHITYPIQSLSLFETCPWDIPIGAAILVEILLLACAGYLLGGVITLCAMFLAGAIEVCLCILIVVFIPMYLVPEEFLFRYPALPSLLFPDLFVFGWRDIDTGEQVYKSGIELVLTGTVVMLAGTVLLCLAERRGQRS